MSQTQTNWTVIDNDSGNERIFNTREEAENAVETVKELGGDPDLFPPGESADEGDSDTAEPLGEEVEIVENVESEPEPQTEPDMDELPERSVADDPLDILPGYMIDSVQGTPALNKRGLSVLAFQYGVTVDDRDYLALPTDTDWESAIVETKVTNEDGNSFVGTGSAHVDRGDDKEVLLELAETRSYKRAVSFATGTGIVAYQELTSEVER